MGGQILQRITCIERSPGLPGTVMEMIKFTLREFWRQFNIKMAIIIRFSLYACSLYAVFAETQIPRFKTVTLHTYANM
jgi:hypothetical protein